MRLHLGCGPLHYEGWINIDKNPKCNPNIVADIKQIREYFEKGIIEEIMIIHTIGYLTRYQALKFFKDCFDLLKPGGRLIVETPDLEKTMKLYPSNKFEYTRVIYGYDNANDPSETPATYLWGWTGETIKEEMEKIGFAVSIMKPQTHNPDRDVRIEAIKNE